MLGRGADSPRACSRRTPKPSARAARACQLTGFGEPVTLWLPDSKRFAISSTAQFVAPLGGKYLDNIEPATGKAYSLVPGQRQPRCRAGGGRGGKAFPGWSRTPAAERSRILLRIAELIDRDLEKFARAESIDTGKPLALARSLDIPRASSNFRFFATAILHTENEAHVMDGVAFNYTLRQPRGVVGLISPWNLPLYLLSWKIAPAIAVGNTAVAKPSELTPMTAYLLGEVCREAGLPDGVLNIVHGTGPNVGSPITAHPKIGTISFTGGTVTGRKVAEAGAPLFKKISLELGGKNPNIIFADADLDAAISRQRAFVFREPGPGLSLRFARFCRAAGL